MNKVPWAGAGNKNERGLTTAGAALKEGESESCGRPFFYD